MPNIDDRQQTASCAVGKPLGKMADQLRAMQRFTLVVNMTTAVQLGVYPALDLIKIAELL